MAEQPVVMNLSNEVLQAFIKASVMSALPEQARLRMVETVVHQALNTKADQYGSRTVFEKALQDVLTEEAQKQCKEYLDELRPIVAKRIREEIKRRDYAEKIVKSLMDNLSIVRVSCRVGEDR